MGTQTSHLSSVEKRVCLESELKEEMEGMDSKSKRLKHDPNFIPDERNPMLNPVVLETLFNVCDLKDLRRFRLVSKLWHDESLQRWRDEMVVYIASEAFPEFRYNPEYYRRRLHWADLGILYELPGIATKPFRKFKVCNWRFPISNISINEIRGPLYTKTLKTRENILSFWSKCGPSMRELELRKPRVDFEGGDGEYLRYVIVEQTPNLVSLKFSDMKDDLDFGRIEDLEQVTSHPNLKVLSIPGKITWCEELLTIFPNLKDIEFQEIQKDESIFGLDSAMAKLAEKGKNVGRKLNVVCEDCVAGFSVIKKMAECKHFACERQVICLYDDVDEPDYSRALEFQRDSLKTLKIDCDSIVPFNLFEVSQPFLSKLSLKFETLYDCNFYFFDQVPNLSVLEIGCNKFQNILPKSRRAEIESLQLEKMSRLCFNQRLTYYELPIQMFVKCMPNLNVLECPLDSTLFTFVCDHCKGLRKLVDQEIKYFCLLDDDGITGIAAEVETRKPNITDLKYLREFRTTSLIISDKSVWNGFLQMENLTGLEVNLSEETSDKAFIELFEKFRTGVQRQDSKEKEKQRLNEEMKRKAQKLSRDYGICLDSYLKYNTVNI